MTHIRAGARAAPPRGRRSCSRSSRRWTSRLGVFRMIYSIIAHFTTLCDIA